MEIDEEIIYRANQLVGEVHGPASSALDQTVSVNFELEIDSKKVPVIVQYQNNKNHVPALWVPVKIVR